MNKKILLGLSIIFFFFIFSDMWLKEKQKTIEFFNDGSPKLIHITRNILGNNYLVRTIELWESGKIRYDKKYKNGRPEGKQLFYSELGEKTEQWIKNGKRHGMYTQWNSDNIIILKEKWKNGKLFKILINLKSEE